VDRCWQALRRRATLGLGRHRLPRARSRELLEDRGARARARAL